MLYPLVETTSAALLTENGVLLDVVIDHLRERIYLNAQLSPNQKRAALRLVGAECPGVRLVSVPLIEPEWQRDETV